jgi:hypothetical protein
MKVSELEAELKQRWAIPYRWYGKQNNGADQQTSYIYQVKCFCEAERTSAERFGRDTPAYHYALNRWYNFWSARAIEALICLHPNAEKAPDFDQQIDFYIDHIPFDHKSTVYPRGFGHGLSYALAHQDEFICWLYQNQSMERRWHLANRLFVVLHAADGAHWKLNAELRWIQTFVDDYVSHFTTNTLHTIQLNGTHTQADIIWCVN